jgi:hypothetical protein
METYDGPAWRLISTLFGLGVGELFRSTTGVHSRPSQLFINKIVDGDL